MNATLASMPRGSHLRIALLISCAGALSALLAMPYVLALMPALERSVAGHVPLFVAAQTLQVFVLFFLLGWAGLRLGAPFGLDAPLLRRALGQTSAPWISAWPRAVLLGVAAGVACIIVTLLMPLQVAGFGQPSWWQGLLSSFYGGIGEEILCRLFLVSLLVWIAARLTGTTHPGRRVYLRAIVIAAVLFGVGHLPALAMAGALTPPNIALVVGLNALCGSVFGWLFWRYGIEHAMVAHFSADIVLHVVAPLF